MHFRKLSRKGQRHILTPVKHLTWSFLVKILKVVPYFYKSSILHVWQSSTAKAPSCMHDKVQTQKLHLACITKFSHKPPSCMYDKIQPQKLHLACMTKFNHKSSTLHVWQSSTTKVPSCMYHKVQPQKLHLACVTKFNHKSFILHVWQSSKYVFASLYTRCSTRRTSHCSCYRVFKQQLLGKSINKKLAVSSTNETFPKNQVFVDVFLIKNYEYAALQKGLLAHCSVRRAL